MTKKIITSAEFFATRERYHKETDKLRAQLREVENTYRRFLSKYDAQSPGGWGA